MLPPATCLQVFELPQNPAIHFVTISEGCSLHSTTVSIFGTNGAQLLEILKPVREIFPESEFRLIKSQVTRVADKILKWDIYRAEKDKEYEITVHHYEGTEEAQEEQVA